MTAPDSQILDAAQKMDAARMRQLLIDEIEAHTEAIESRGYWATGSRGQRVVNPAVVQRRAAMDLLRKMGDEPASAGDELSEFGLS